MQYYIGNFAYIVENCRKSDILKIKNIVEQSRKQVQKSVTVELSINFVGKFWKVTGIIKICLTSAIAVQDFEKFVENAGKLVKCVVKSENQTGKLEKSFSSKDVKFIAKIWIIVENFQICVRLTNISTLSLKLPVNILENS